MSHNNPARNTRYDIEMQSLQTLSQKLAHKEPRLAEYACNTNAPLMAQIDSILAIYKLPEAMELELKLCKKILQITGEANWINKSDVLTNLGLKLGRTGIDQPLRGKRADIP